MNRAPRLLAAAVALAAVLAGCATKPKPPVVNLWDRKGLAILPFAGDPHDDALAGDLRTALLAGYRALGAVTVADPARADAVAARAAAGSTSPWTDPAWRAAAGSELGADVLLTGAVREFKESWDAETPKRLRSQVDPSYRWGATDTATVHFLATLQLVQVASGAVLWTKKLPADGRIGRWVDLPWPGENVSPPAGGWSELLAGVRPAPPPAGTPRYRSDSTAARAREEAISDVVRVALADYVGQDGWTPPARPARP